MTLDIKFSVASLTQAQGLGTFLFPFFFLFSFLAQIENTFNCKGKVQPPNTTQWDFKK